MKNFSLKTKGSSLLNSKERSKGKTYVFLIVFAFGALFLGHNFIGNIFASVTAPLYSIKNYFETSGATVPYFIRDRNALVDQIRTLEEEVSSSQGALDTVAGLVLENNELRSLLQASSSPRIAAGVLSRPPFTPYDSLVIDRGERDGIVEYAPVYHGGGTALGYVRKVFSQNAIVTLFSSPGVESTVYIFGPNIFATAHGEGGGIIRLSVPQGIVVQKGDIVVLPSLDTGVLGMIDAVQSVPTEPEQHAYVTLSAPLQSIRLVSVGVRSLEAVTFEDALIQVERDRETLFSIPVPDTLYREGLVESESLSTSTEPEIVLETPPDEIFIDETEIVP